MEYERLSYGETVDYLVAAIDNIQRVYESVRADAQVIAGLNGANAASYAALSFATFEERHGYEVRSAFPWLVSDSVHLAAEWGICVLRCIEDAEEER